MLVVDWERKEFTLVHAPSKGGYFEPSGDRDSLSG
jgi:hypothetical protein